ncbi:MULTISPECIES: hypothetical protein [Bacillus cereus group]|uniref:hypothetical protein n=1 Tax=Bacillus cereus group TaxID=86661 RepID=UPI0011A0B668|nr:MULTISPECIES: hypothetical protein [Bacillus cereus group]MCB5895968.1 hypothetical protein [Bacillus cereus]
MTTDTMYNFLGHKFTEYIDFGLFKKTAEEQLNYTNDTEDIEQYYKGFLDSRLSRRKELDKILFENILYGQLKNVFTFKLSSNPSLDADIFQESMKQFIKQMNEGKVSPEVYAQMSSESFYLMESLNIGNIGSKFLAGFDFTRTADNKVDTARFLVVQVVPLKNRQTGGYFIGGVEINYTEQTLLFMIRNISNNISKDYTAQNDESNDWNENLMGYYHYLVDLFTPKLGLGYLPHDAQNDRKVMFQMCKDLDEALLSEVRDEVNRRIGLSNTEVRTLLFKKLFPKTTTFSEEELKEFEERLDSLLLATFINKTLYEEELVDIAKEKQLVGYPTKIAFKSDTATKGSAGSSGKESPIASSAMFHNLYTDLQDASELPQWSISWFNDYHHLDSNDTSVIQTTIVSHNKYLQIIFKNRKHLNKELLHHVIRNINQYRS